MAGRKAKGFKLDLGGKICLSVLITMVLVAGTLVYQALYPGLPAEARAVLPGVNVEGVDLSNLQRGEGIGRLAALDEKLRASTVDLSCNGVLYQTTLGALGLSVDRDKTMDRALAMGDQLGVFKRWYAEVRPVERRLSPVLDLDREQLRQTLRALMGPLEVEAREARLEVTSGDRVQVVPSSDGYLVDVDLLAERLTSEQGLAWDQAVEVPVKVLKPGTTTEQVQSWGVTGLLAGYTTPFNPQQANRNHNIAIAAAKLDGLLVAPGEVFSFNGRVGPRGTEQGYKMANVIIGNKLEEGLGGGICQVSTTLYNAVLRADLEVEQRSAHNIPVSYVPVGLDAAVAYDYMDFKFRNNTGSYVLVKTHLGNSSLTVKLYGSPNPGKTVYIKSWVTKTIAPGTVYRVDEQVEPGQRVTVQKGASGYHAAAERVVLVEGKEVKREPLPASKYRPVEHIIAVHSADEIPVATEQEEFGADNPVENPKPGDNQNSEDNQDPEETIQE